MEKAIEVMRQSIPWSRARTARHVRGSVLWYGSLTARWGRRVEANCAMATTPSTRCWNARMGEPLMEQSFSRRWSPGSPGSRNPPKTLVRRTDCCCKDYGSLGWYRGPRPDGGPQGNQIFAGKRRGYPHVRPRPAGYHPQREQGFHRLSDCSVQQSLKRNRRQWCCRSLRVPSLPPTWKISHRRRWKRYRNIAKIEDGLNSEAFRQRLLRQGLLKEQKRSTGAVRFWLVAFRETAARFSATGGFARDDSLHRRRRGNSRL